MRFYCFFGYPFWRPSSWITPEIGIQLQFWNPKSHELKMHRRKFQDFLQPFHLFATIVIIHRWSHVDLKLRPLQCRVSCLCELRACTETFSKTEVFDVVLEFRRSNLIELCIPGTQHVSEIILNGGFYLVISLIIHWSAYPRSACVK